MLDSIVEGSACKGVVILSRSRVPTADGWRCFENASPCTVSRTTVGVEFVDQGDRTGDSIARSEHKVPGHIINSYHTVVSEAASCESCTHGSSSKHGQGPWEMR